MKISKLNKRVIVSILLSLISSSVFAGSCGRLQCTGKVETLYMPNTSYIYIGTSGDETSLECEAVSSKYVKLDRSHQGFEEAYTALLAAHHTNRSVKIRVSGGIGKCQVQYIVSLPV